MASVLSSPLGGVHILALDHGVSFTRRLAEGIGEQPTETEVVAAKLEILDGLSDVIDQVVCDPGPFLDAAVEEGRLSPTCAVIAGFPDLVEVSHGTSDDLRRALDQLPIPLVAAAKLCVQLGSTPTTRLLDVASGFVEGCRSRDIEAIIEVIDSSVTTRRATVGARGGDDRLIGAITSFAALDPELLKLPYPIPPIERDEARTCERITSAARSVPWALLSAGAEFVEFHRRLEIACRGGAAGFVAGTAVWQEVLTFRQASDRRRYVRSVCRPRLDRLKAVVESRAAAQQ